MKCHKNATVKSSTIKQENVSFVEFFEAQLFEAIMDALTKNSVALIQTAEEDASNHS